MGRPLSFWLALALLAGGCAKPVPTLTPPPGPVAVAPPATAEAPNPTPQEAAPKPVTPLAPVTPPAAVSSPLRDWLARYLPPDGSGSPQEKAALELEKLAPTAAELLPLLADKQVEIRRGAAYYLLSEFNPADDRQ